MLFLLLVAPFVLGEGKKSMISLLPSDPPPLSHVFIRWIFHWRHFPSDCLKPCDSGALYSGNWSTTVRLSRKSFFWQITFLPLSLTLSHFVFGLFLYCVDSSLESRWADEHARHGRRTHRTRTTTTIRRRISAGLCLHNLIALLCNASSGTQARAPDPGATRRTLTRDGNTVTCQYVRQC